MSREHRYNPEAFYPDEDAAEAQAAYDDYWGAPLIPWWEDR